MKTLNKKTADKYAALVGGTNNAVTLIMNALGCSQSKAVKIRRALYPHPLGKLELSALANLYGCSEREVLLPVDGSRKLTTKKTAS